MNWKTWTPLALAIVLGLIAAKIGRDLVRGNHAPAPVRQMLQVVVARQDFPPGHELQAQDLSVLQIAGQTIPEGMFTTPITLVGRVTALPLSVNQPLMESFLVPTGAGAGLQALVPEGMRAITIEVNEFSGLAGLLTPGCRVDVIATLQGEQKQELVSRTVVQNVRVTAVGPRLSVRGDEDRNQVVKSVTLLVSPRQAEALELACATGRPRLVLRGFRDAIAAETSGATLAQLRGSLPNVPTTVEPAAVFPATQPAVAAVPTETPMTSRTVQVLRGGIESRVQFTVPAVHNGVFTDVNLDPLMPSEHSGH